MIGALTVDGEMRSETAMFIAWACAWQAAHPDILQDVLVICEAKTPTPVARNCLVKQAQDRRVDILFMIDDDMGPPVLPGPNGQHSFFEFACQFLMDQSTPSVIAVPYVTAPPQEDVLVFEWASMESATADIPWKLSRIHREDAARRTGTQRVANIGTGCIAYDMRVFRKIQKPYFNYQYNDEMTVVLETEDCWNGRLLYTAGVPVYCAWDHWSLHCKTKKCGKPRILKDSDIHDNYLRQADSLLKARAESAKDKLTADDAYRLIEIIRKNEQGECSATVTPATPSMFVTDRTALVANADYVREFSETVPAMELTPRSEPFSIEDAANWARSVPGWMHPEELRWLASLAAALPPGSAWIEVGTWKGRSLSAVCLAAPAGTAVWAIDSWTGAHQPGAATDNGECFQEFLQTLERLRELRKNSVIVNVEHGESVHVATEEKDCMEANVIFLDGDHARDAVLADIQAWSRHFMRGAPVILCGHDRNDQGVRAALNEAFGDRWKSGPGTLWLVNLKTPAEEPTKNGRLEHVAV
jgi:hypothetical protein